MRPPIRARGLPLAAFASLFFLPDLFAPSTPARAADLGGIASMEDEDAAYDYGDADYVAPSPVYAAIRGAVTSHDLSADHAGVGVSVAAGVDLDQMYSLSLMRLEIELDYMHQSGPVSGSNDAEVYGVAGFVSLYRDLGEFYRWRPYAGAGVGVAHLQFDAAPAVDDESNGIAWHVTTGVSVDWSERATLDFGYRYTGVEGIDLTSASAAGETDRFDTHAVFTGLRFRL